MTAPKALLLTLLMLALPLTGCIGGDDVESQNLADDLSGRAERPATAARAHVAGSAGEATTAVEGDVEDLLPEGVPVPVGTSRFTGGEAFEPTLGVTSDGAVFMSNFEPHGLASGTPWTLLRRSTDQGLTWEDVTPQTVEGVASFPPQSNDPYVHVDPDTDRVFLSDLQLLMCSTLSWSDDGGETWTRNPIGCGQPFGVHDHQTLFTSKPRTLQTQGYANVVHYCINRVADTSCAFSLDGGLTFSPLRPLVYKGVDPEAGGFCGGLTAHGTSGPDGRIYLGKGHCDKPTVVVSEDDGLTWTQVTISEEVPAARHDVEIAVDEAGNVYAVWESDDDLPYLAVSTDGGMSWSDAVNVAPPDVHRTAFPAISAGAEGRVALVFIGTSSEDEIEDMDGADTWTGYLTVITNATTGSPILLTSAVHDPADPIARGPCDDDNRCDGMGDFLDVVIDGEGRPWGAFVDVCNAQCAEETGNDEPLAFVGTLATGPTLRGPIAALAELPVTPPAQG